jgi:hypothetical protein
MMQEQWSNGDGGVNSTTMYSKHFVNVTMYPQHINNKKRRKNQWIYNINRMKDKKFTIISTNTEKALHNS